MRTYTRRNTPVIFLPHLDRFVLNEFVSADPRRKSITYAVEGLSHAPTFDISKIEFLISRLEFNSEVCEEEYAEECAKDG